MKWFCHADNLPRRVDRRLQRLEAARPVIVERHVVLARPLDLHRDAAGLLRDQRRLAHAVVREPAAETTAAAQLMQRDLVLRQAKQFRDGVDGVLRRLRRRPDLDVVALEPSRAVLRLEIGVRHVVIRIQGFDGLAGGECGFNVARLTENLLRGLRRQRLRLRDGARPTVARRSALVPLHLQCFLRLQRGPRGIADDGDSGQHGGRGRVERDRVALRADDECVLDAGQLTNLVEIGRYGTSADRGRLRVGRVHHAGHALIDAEQRLAAHELGVVDAREALAEQTEARLRLQRDAVGARHRHRGSKLGELAVRCATVAGRMPHGAVLGGELGRGHVPGFGGGCDEHRARGRAGTPQHVEIHRDRQRTARELRAIECRVDDGLPHLDLGPIRIELFGDDER